MFRLGPPPRRIQIGFHRLGLLLGGLIALGGIGTAASMLATIGEEPDVRWSAWETYEVRLTDGHILNVAATDDREAIDGARSYLASLSSRSHAVSVEPQDSIVRLPVPAAADVSLGALLERFAADDASNAKNESPAVTPAADPYVGPDTVVRADAQIAMRSSTEWWRLGLSGAIVALAALVYAALRAVGWIVDGFVARPGV